MERSAPGTTSGEGAAGPPVTVRPLVAGQATPVAFTVDHQARVTSWSAAATALFGRPATDALGRPCHALFPPQVLPAVTECRERTARGEECRAELPVRCGDGSVCRVVMDCSPLLDATGKEGMLCQVAEAGRRRLEETRAAFVDAVMESSPFGLGMLDTDLRYVMVNDALAEFNGMPAADHIGLRLRDVVRAEGLDAYDKRIREVAETGEPLHNLLISGHGPGNPDRDGAWAATFFRINGRGGEILGLGGMLVDVSEKQSALLEASAVRQRLALVNEASTRIGTTLEMACTARELTEVAVPAFVDIATVDIRTSLFDDGDFPPADRPVRTRRLAGRSVLANGAADRMLAHGREVVHPIGSRTHRTLHAGHPWLVEGFDDHALDSFAHDDEHGRMVRATGIHSLVMVPLIARGRLLGLACFGRSARREPMNADDLKLAQELAARAALCLDNAQMYSNERRIAVALQRSMLPGEKDIPCRPGLEIAHHYRPSTRAARVGGDWFDVIPLSGHRIALVVGDMMGHDIRAAANMGQLRAAMRTLARLDLEPVDLMTRLDDVVQRDGTVQYATCVYAVYDTVTRLCSIVNAGHPAPVLRHRDRSTEVVRVSPGVPLGVGVGDPQFTVTDVVLPEDSTLVLYTDGLVERRGADIDAGLDALREALAQPAADVQKLCDQVVARLHRRAEEDDLAVLMARAPFVAGHRSARWKMRPDPKSASHARSLVRSTLVSWELAALVDTAELLVSELVTNAVRHARGEIELRLAKGGTLVCEVADGDERMPRRYQADAADERGRGLMLVGELADDWGTRPTAHGKVVWFEHALPGPA
jgi:PAS domain S-box-containing protein